ncbi:MAG TPA: DUF1254 domain-containing protein [Flavobacterium sp.]|nr:DUF1254 domain-containing protein [Flavobacterium sp.]
MFKKIGIILVSIVVLIGVLFLYFDKNTKQDLVREAYIYGYPLITMDLVRKQETNVAFPDDSHAPMGQLIKMRTYPAVDNHTAAAPNAETLYTMVWYDLSKEPWIFSIPEIDNRYYIMPMLSAFNEVFYVAGSRATGQKSQTYVLTGPGWKGKLPEGIIEVKSPTALVWILGRVYCTGSKEDYKLVHQLQDQFQSIPLSSFGKPYSPTKAVVDTSIDMKTSVRDQVNNMPLEEYFTYVSELLKKNPPKPEDAPLMSRLAEIGIVPG